jgi:hypothetical protein
VNFNRRSDLALSFVAVLAGCKMVFVEEAWIFVVFRKNACVRLNLSALSGAISFDIYTAVRYF